MKVSKLVEQVLKDWPEARDSDRFLLVKVWERQMGQPMHPNLKEFVMHKAFSPESIRRTRQKFQEQGQYPASKKVDDARFEKFRQVKSNVHGKPEQLGLI